VKRYLNTIAIALVLAYILHIIVYRFSYTLKTVSDVLFFVGILMFFISLLSISGANKVFITLGYSFRSIFGRQHKKYDNLYDYTQAKDKKKLGKYGNPMIFVGIIMVIASLILAYLSLNN
jgi:hypothetical protein